MTKQELLNGLTTILNNFLYGLMMPRVLIDNDWKRVTSPTAQFQGPPPVDTDILTVDLRDLLANVHDPVMNKVLVQEHENVHKRAIVSEGHEIILAYCEESGQFPKYKATSWFQFARIIRNVVSHKQAGFLVGWPKDLTKAGVTSVIWRHKTLDTSMIGKAVTFTHYDAMKLYQDQLAFATNDLE